MRKILFLFTIIFLPVILLAQEASEIKVSRERTFTGVGLYGFMNGGADLYIEYGVQELITRDVVYKGEEYTIDIYTMPSAVEAYGIYSVNIHSCDRADELDCFDCLSPYQLQLAVGDKYVSVVFPSGSAAAQANADEVVKRYIAIDKVERIPAPSELQLALPYSGRLKYFNGPLSLSNTDFSLSTTLDGISFSGIWYVVDKKEKEALVYVKTEADLQKLEGKLTQEAIISKGESFVYFRWASK